MLELRCSGVNECSFIIRGQTNEQALEAWVDHASKRHGIRYFPPEFYAQIKRRMQAIQAEQGPEVPCRDLNFCEFIARGETPEQILEFCAEHASKEHGMMSFPPEWYVQMRRHITAIQG